MGSLYRLAGFAARYYLLRNAGFTHTQAAFKMLGWEPADPVPRGEPADFGVAP